MNAKKGIPFKFVGTAAAEGIPALFCQCETCRRAAEAGGRNIRGRSGALIGGRVLIDFPPDMLTYKLRYGLDLAEVSHVFITHSHIDHLAANELCYYHKGYAVRNRPDSVLTVYGNPLVLEVIRESFRFDMGKVPRCIALKEITPFSGINVGDVTLTPLTADHDRREACVFYLIEGNGRRMLFANDTTRFPAETCEYLSGRRLDIVSLDCTTGKFPCRRSHMGFPDNLVVREKLVAQNSADGETLFISHHFSHNGGINYDDFAALAGDSGFVSSWDGMEVFL